MGKTFKETKGKAMIEAVRNRHRCGRPARCSSTFPTVQKIGKPIAMLALLGRRGVKKVSGSQLAQQLFVFGDHFLL